MESVQSEELMHEGSSLFPELGGDLLGSQGFVEILDNEILRMRSAEAPEIDQQAIPRSFIFVAMLECLERQKRRSPGESRNDIFVAAKNVECGTYVPS